MKQRWRHVHWIGKARQSARQLITLFEVWHTWSCQRLWRAPVNYVLASKVLCILHKKYCGTRVKISGVYAKPRQARTSLLPFCNANNRRVYTSLSQSSIYVPLNPPKMENPEPEIPIPCPHLPRTSSPQLNTRKPQLTRDQRRYILLMQVSNVLWCGGYHPLA